MGSPENAYVFGFAPISGRGRLPMVKLDSDAGNFEIMRAP
jgi:hypothetical protein